MEKIKTILDREPLNSEYINSKQDFNKVLDGFQKLKPPVWKTGWFYGTVGLASLALIFTTVSLTSSDLEKDALKTASNSENVTYIAPKSNETKSTVVVKPKTEETEDTEPVAITPLIADSPPIVEESPIIERATPEEEPPVIVPEVITTPHIAGTHKGPIPFKDFCDPLGIQVNESISVVEYTLHYFSCTQEVTVKIRGSKIPPEVCKELNRCGERIEVDFDFSCNGIRKIVSKYWANKTQELTAV